MKSGNGGKWSWEEENILILCDAPERERVEAYLRGVVEQERQLMATAGGGKRKRADIDDG